MPATCRRWPTSMACSSRSRPMASPPMTSPTEAGRTNRWASSGPGTGSAGQTVAPKWPPPPTSTESASSAPRRSLRTLRKSGWGIPAISRTWATGPSARASTASCSIAMRPSHGSTSSPAFRWDPLACTMSGRRPGGSNPVRGTSTCRVASICSSRGGSWPTSATSSQRARRGLLARRPATAVSPTHDRATTSTVAPRKWC